MTSSSQMRPLPRALASTGPSSAGFDADGLGSAGAGYGCVIDREEVGSRGVLAELHQLHMLLKPRMPLSSRITTTGSCSRTAVSSSDQTWANPPSPTKGHRADVGMRGSCAERERNAPAEPGQTPRRQEPLPGAAGPQVVAHPDGGVTGISGDHSAAVGERGVEFDGHPLRPDRLDVCRSPAADRLMVACTGGRDLRFEVAARAACRRPRSRSSSAASSASAVRRASPSSRTPARSCGRSRCRPHRSG